MSIRSSSFVARSGPVRVPVYASTFQGYTSYTVSWSINGKRQRRKFSDRALANAFAQATAERIANGLSTAQTLTASELSEYREAKQILGHLSLIDAALAFRDRNTLAAAPAISAAVVSFVEFKAALQRRRALNPDYLRNLRQRLDVFSTAFPCRLDDLKAADLQSWINRLPGSLRTKNNYLADVRQLVTHAKRQRWLPPTFDELDRVQLERAGPGTIHPYSPAEVAKLLRHCQDHDVRWLPWLPVRLFSGVRTAESLRLLSDHIHADWIVCAPEITKTQNRRLIPILPNLRAWLNAYPPPDRLAPFPESGNLSPRLTELIQAAGLQPRHNGFRDSFASYRLALVQDAARVAEETGHDARQLRRSYREIRLPDGQLITPALAKAYFKIRPKSRKHQALEAVTKPA